MAARVYMAAAIYRNLRAMGARDVASVLGELIREVVLLERLASVTGTQPDREVEDALADAAEIARAHAIGGRWEAAVGVLTSFRAKHLVPQV